MLGPVAALVALAACATPATTPASRNILWRIVAECVDVVAPDYCTRCAWPRDAVCGVDRACPATTDVWAESPQFVAIRDVKMCGCPAGFVHGLALPRERVTGVEDPRRPPGIWPFAWAVAHGRIADEHEIALVVNPSRNRTQDQLHVHLVRLRPGARDRLAAGSSARAAALDEVWAIAARQAAALGVDDYGVLVARDPSTQEFLVLVEPGSPEEHFTASSCR